MLVVSLPVFAVKQKHQEILKVVIGYLIQNKLLSFMLKQWMKMVNITNKSELVILLEQNQVVGLVPMLICFGGVS